jgi:hypothetical protein
MDVDLGRRQPDAGRFVHGLSHVGGEPGERLVEHGNRRGATPETLVGIVQNREQCHKNILKS